MMKGKKLRSNMHEPGRGDVTMNTENADKAKSDILIEIDLYNNLYELATQIGLVRQYIVNLMYKQEGSRETVDIKVDDEKQPRATGKLMMGFYLGDHEMRLIEDMLFQIDRNVDNILKEQ